MPPNMTLYALISTIWTTLSPTRPAQPPPKKRGRRPHAFSPSTIEPKNHWYPGGRNRQQPRRLDETPVSAHYPKFRVAKSVVTKRRRRCEACGALVKEEGALLKDGRGGNAVRTVRKKSAVGKAVERRELEFEREFERQMEREMEMGLGRRRLRGRVVVYDE